MYSQSFLNGLLFPLLIIPSHSQYTPLPFVSVHSLKLDIFFPKETKEFLYKNIMNSNNSANSLRLYIHFADFVSFPTRKCESFFKLEYVSPGHYRDAIFK